MGPAQVLAVCACVSGTSLASSLAQTIAKDLPGEGERAALVRCLRDHPSSQWWEACGALFPSQISWELSLLWEGWGPDEEAAFAGELEGTPSARALSLSPYRRIDSARADDSRKFSKLTATPAGELLRLGKKHHYLPAEWDSMCAFSEFADGQVRTLGPGAARYAPSPGAIGIPVHLSSGETIVIESDPPGALERHGDGILAGKDLRALIFTLFPAQDCGPTRYPEVPMDGWDGKAQFVARLVGDKAVFITVSRTRDQGDLLVVLKGSQSFTYGPIRDMGTQVDKGPGVQVDFLSPPLTYLGYQPFHPPKNRGNPYFYSFRTDLGDTKLLEELSQQWRKFSGNQAPTCLRSVSLRRVLIAHNERAAIFYVTGDGTPSLVPLRGNSSRLDQKTLVQFAHGSLLVASSTRLALYDPETGEKKTGLVYTEHENTNYKRLPVAREQGGLGLWIQRTGELSYTSGNAVGPEIWEPEP